MRIILFLFTIMFMFSCSKSVVSSKEERIKFKNTGRHIGINMKLENYKKAFFYFDTGSAWLMIDSTYLKSQKINFRNTIEYKIEGVGNSVKKNIKVLDTINFNISKNKFYSEYSMITDLRGIVGKNIDGIVGFHNFRGIPFKIDYVAKKITFNPKIEDDYHEVHIGFDGFLMFIPMEIELSNKTIIRGNFIIDTGSSSTALTSEFTDNKGVTNNLKSTYINNGGIGGLSQGYSLFVSNINIDEFNLNNKLIDVVTDTLGALSKNENYIGLIGNDILDNFDIIYHPSHSKIWVKPNKNFNKPTEDLYKGFVLIETNEHNKGWIVGSIYEESDAYKNGLRHNDEIVEINNKSVQKLNSEKFMTKLKPNQKLKLKVKRANEYFEINTHLNVFLKKND